MAIIEDQILCTWPSTLPALHAVHLHCKFKTHLPSIHILQGLCPSATSASQTYSFQQVPKFQIIPPTPFLLKVPNFILSFLHFYFSVVNLYYLL